MIVFEKILVYMENSIFFRAVTAMLNFFSRMFSGSIFIQSISTEQDKAKLELSFLYRLCSSAFKLFQNIGRAKLFSLLENTLIAKMFILLPFTGIIAVIILSPFIPTMLTAGIIILTLLLFIVKIILDKNFNFSLDLIGYWIFIFIFITLFKGVTSLSLVSSLKIAALTTLFMVFYFLFISIVDTGKKLDIVMLIFCTGALIVGLYGLYQQYSGKVDMTWVDRSLFEDVKLRVFSTFDNPNVYGEYLLLAIPISIISGVVFKNIFIKLYCFGISVLLIFNLALTYSRGCYLAIAFGVLVFIMFMEKRLIVLFSAGIFVLPFILPPSIINRILSIANLSDSSTSYRIMIWQSSVRILRDFWPSGVGQGIDAYNAVYPLYSFNGISAPHSHNLFLQIFVETGIIGILSFLAIIFCFYKTLIPFFYKAKNISQKVFAAGFMSLMSAFMMQSFFDYSFYNYKVFLIFFLTLAIASAYVRLENDYA